MSMRYQKPLKIGAAISLVVQTVACTPSVTPVTSSLVIPASYEGSADKEAVPFLKWRDFFSDDHLQSLIDTALKNNQELNISVQEIEVAKNEVTARSGAYLPFLNIGAGSGFDKTARYTREGAFEANNDIKPGKPFPEPLHDYSAGFRATWEVDIWRKLRNAEKSAINTFLATAEGRNFIVTTLVGEIASSYYELLALDSQLALVRQNVEIQQKALNSVRLEKASARVTELAVKRFEAQLLKTQSIQFDIQQKIIQTENKINFLVGRLPQPVERSPQSILDVEPTAMKVGIPAQLIQQRPDIRQAEQEMAAADLDVKVAKAAFYPSLTISGDLGLRAFTLANILETPTSLLYALTGDVAGPLLNRRAITAEYLNANAKQIQAMFRYERAVLSAFAEVANQVAGMKNLGESLGLRKDQVSALTESVTIAGTLFTAGRADYTEVLLTQRDALESRFELIETKLNQMRTVVGLYRSLGGGWQ